MIATHQHLRIVTAHDVATTGSLNAADWPLDWREAEDAHGAWAPASHPNIEAQARQLADNLHLGYSSQDWLLTSEGDAFFIDLNPAVQWLFLPPSVADPITDRLAEFLSGAA